MSTQSIYSNGSFFGNSVVQQAQQHTVIVESEEGSSDSHTVQSRVQTSLMSMERDDFSVNNT